MIMKGFPVTFNVYADTSEEAETASRAIKDFINAKARIGVAVTADKLTKAIEKWRDSIIVTNYFR